MACIRAKSKEAKDAAERLREHVAATATDLRRARNRKRMAHIRSKSKEARDAVTTAAAADLRRANINVDHNSKKKTALSAHMVEYPKNWMMSPEHVDHPYPTEDEKLRIMSETGIVLKQLTNWFVNNRKRFWKPKVKDIRSSTMSLTALLFR
jgi:hypothetical protein